MFIGEYNYSIDSKNRVVIPSEFRPELGDTMYLGRGLDKCLFVFDEQECRLLQQKYSALSDLSENARNLKRLIFSGMVRVSPDSQGRIKITPPLMQYSSIKKEVVIIGAENRVEIWAKELWDKLISEKGNNIGSLAEIIDSKINRI